MSSTGRSLCEPDESLNPGELIGLFDELFKHTENTILVSGGEEPVYFPADTKHRHHRIVFAHGYFASALHEIAHWCIAGQERRQQLDYGYWYAADGRNAAQQQAFETVEVKPQALEWMFSRACNKAFQVSVDNLEGVATDPSQFKWRVFQQVRRYCETGVPVRAQQWIAVLSAYYGSANPFDSEGYAPEEIGLSLPVREPTW